MVGDQIGVTIMWRKPRTSRLVLVRHLLAPKKTQMHKVVKLQSDQNVLHLKKLSLELSLNKRLWSKTNNFNSR